MWGWAVEIRQQIKTYNEILSRLQQSAVIISKLKTDNDLPAKLTIPEQLSLDKLLANFANFVRFYRMESKQVRTIKKELKTFDQIIRNSLVIIQSTLKQYSYFGMNEEFLNRYVPKSAKNLLEVT